MARRGLITAFLAGSVIAAHRIVKHGDEDGTVVQASAATDGVFGVSDIGEDAEGEHTDIIMSDSAEVEYGGAVTRGDLLTADAEGKAVKAAAGNRSIGVALVSGVAGDIGEVMISQGKA